MPTRSAEPDKPISFGYKCAWYAMRTNDIEAAVLAMGLAGTVESSWAHGVEAAHSDKVFVTPPLGGWILALGRTLFHVDTTHAESVVPMLTKLSSVFGEAQYFATHRVVEAHCWALARVGKLIRAYAYVGDQGEITWDEGQPTEAELALGEGALEFPGPNESQLMQIAEAWSINPSELESTFNQPSLGRLGQWVGSPAAAVCDPVEVDCEECGRRCEFPAEQNGSVQECPHCGAYLDVGDAGLPEDWADAAGDPDDHVDGGG
jgi:hypothetical protein